MNNKEIKLRQGDDGESILSLCNYDKEKCCNCMTYSIDEGTNYRCAKCGAVK